MRRNGPSAPFRPPRPFSSGSSTAKDSNGGSAARDVSPAAAKNVVAITSSTTTPNPVPPSAKKNSSQENKPVVKRLKVSPTVPVASSAPKAAPKPTTSRSYIVQWRKKTTKKNKTWDGDGTIQFNGSSITFNCDVKGNGKYKVVGSTPRKSVEGLICIGSYELEVDCEVTSDQDTNPSMKDETKPHKPPKLQHQIGGIQFKKVLPTNTARVPTQPRQPQEICENALIMKRTSPNSIDVVVDPILSNSLRPHQREGVSFLYECVMGLRGSHINGALLADEMGLGKTLMTISLIYTLLKQSPYEEDNRTGTGNGVCKKVLIACPVTLIGNWKKEFKKWLGIHKVSVLAINSKQSTAKDKQDIRNFGKTKVYNVMILSYEKLLSCHEDLKGIKFDLLVCDEGHRLKNSSNKTVQIFKEHVHIKKKVLLTGTPMQNDLVEFFNICNFINPGILGTFASFQREFLKPILRSREPNCINKDTIRNGEAKSAALVQLTKTFTLRRTSSILSKYLTPKTDLIIFCPPTSKQVELFHFISNTHKFKKLMDYSGSSTFSNETLSIIGSFRKICNSPSLLIQDKAFQNIRSESDATVKNDSFTSSALEKSSGKVQVLIPLLIEIQKVKEKTVIISNYTQTLDLLEEVLRKLNISFTRLDGSTPNTMRDKLVNEFNTLPISVNSVFLLSAKSGGVGLNLIGASRLIMFDNDWNPSVDLQAMARIHRDGQKKPVFIYRLLTTGCIDEKIFQRQLVKNSLSDKFVDNKNGSNSDVFDIHDLKDLFTVNTDTKSNTHDLLECECNGIGEDLLLDSQDESQGQEDEDKENTEKDDSDISPPGWISALDFKQEDKVAIKKKASMRNALQEYNHYEPSNYDHESGDTIISKVIINSKKSPISYLLTKYTTNELDE